MSNDYIGRVIGGRYEIREFVGRGRVTDVYKALHIQRSDYVAFKVIHINLTKGEAFAEHFDQLGAALAALKHTNILPVQNFGRIQTDKVYYMVAAYSAAPTLGTMLQHLGEGQPLAMSEALRIGRETARALSYAHRQGVVHGDIRPANVVVQPDGRVLVTDFGLIDLVSQTAHQIGAGLGDPTYRAPEQNSGQPPSPRADIYALGLMLERMLTGRQPEPGTALSATTGIPEPVAALIRKASAAAPKQRYDSAEVLADRLAQLSEQSRTGTLRLTSPPPEQPPSIEPEATIPERLPSPVLRPATITPFTDNDPPAEPPVPAGAFPKERKTPVVLPRPLKEDPEPPPRRWLPIVLGLGGLGILAAVVALVVLTRGSGRTPGGLSPEEATQTASAVWIAARATEVSMTGTALMQPTATATATATTAATATASASATAPPTATATAAATASATATTTATMTAFATATATVTPTETASATATASVTATTTPTASVTATTTAAEPPTATASASATATPLAYVPMPFLADFENAGSLASWNLDRDAWQQVTASTGDHELHGTGSADQPAVVLGQSALPPAWAYDETGGVVIAVDFNLPADGGMRLALRSGQRGFYGLRVLAESVTLQRAPVESDLLNIDSGRPVATWEDAPVTAGRWHHLLVWLDGANIFVYIDGALGIQFNDATLTEPGDIVLQAFNASPDNPLKLDDLRIQRPLPASDHFDGPEWPSTWTQNPEGGASLLLDQDNQHASTAGRSELAPDTGALDNFTLACRYRNSTGGFRLYARESAEAGAYLLDFEAGALSVLHLAPDGSILASAAYDDFYTPGDWELLTLRADGDRLSIGDDHATRHDSAWGDAPAAGTLRFALTGNDSLALDDCLLYTLDAPAADPGAFVWEVLDALDAELGAPEENTGDYYAEHFDDAQSTAALWEDGAPGQHLQNPDAAEPAHTAYYQIAHLGRPTWRRWVDDLDLFGGQTSDFLARVEVNFPDDRPGSAWLGGRARLTPTGLDTYHYRIQLNQALDGALTLTVSLRHEQGPATLWEGPMPETNDPGGWHELTIIALGDRVAFLANGQLVYVETEALPRMSKGSIVIGVEPNTVACFDELVVRGLSDLATW